LTHRFNLRDRKKISYNKKYGGFVLVNPEADPQDSENEEEEEGEDASSS
jgi:hypothetical protein